MKRLYIAEKASVGRALAEALPGRKTKHGTFLRCGEDVVAWAAGHLLELCAPEDYDARYRQWGFDTLLYVPSQWRRKEMATAKNLLDPLKKLIKGLDPKADVIVHAGDSDREGQLLIDEILDYYGWRGRTLRLRINDVNAPAIRRALENMRDNAEYRGEYRVGQARQYADWLAGLALTRFVTVSLRAAGYDTAVKSVGRVQAPTLGLVVARDTAISEFVERPYWELRAALSLNGDRTVNGRWLPGEKASTFIDDLKRIVDFDAARSLLSKIDGQNGSISLVTQKEHRAAPPLPYSLSRLQIAASQKYDITDTLTHLQKLYEAGYVTYPRTDCDYLPEGHFAEAGRVLEAVRVGCPGIADMLSGVDPSRKSPAWNDKKVTEHHAIIPTVRVPLRGALSDTERRIYELVCARYAMQFLADCEYRETVVEFDVNGEKFRASGRTILNIGWQGWETAHAKDAKGDQDDKNAMQENESADEDGDEKNEVQILPQVREGEVGAVQGSLDEKRTKPPKPYTWHALIRDMNNVHNYVQDAEIKAKLKEIQGIGTSATQENVIKMLFNRGYLEKRKKSIYPTELGRGLIRILSGGKAAVIVRPDLTALWEQKMSDIERGAPLEPFVAEVADMVRGMISERLEIPTDILGMPRLQNDVVWAPCPRDCGGNARRFMGRYGYFWKCSCSSTIFKDVDGKPVLRTPPATADCPLDGCGGKVTRLLTKQDKRLFWLCDTCGSFFDDTEGRPAIRAKSAEKRRKAKC